MGEHSKAPRLRGKRKAFLGAFAKTGNVSHAARAAEVGRRSHYEWMADPDYVAAFQDAQLEAWELLEAEALRRAVQGVTRPVFYQGAQVSSIREYSDTLLIFLMKGAMPAKYRDNATIEHTGAGGGPVSLIVEFVRPKAA